MLSCEDYEFLLPYARYILQTISLAPPRLINNKMSKLVINVCIICICSRHAFWLFKYVRYSLHCALRCELDNWILKGEGSTIENHTCDADASVIILCKGVLNITIPNWYEINFLLSVKDFVPQYTYKLILWDIIDVSLTSPTLDQIGQCMGQLR